MDVCSGEDEVDDEHEDSDDEPNIDATDDTNHKQNETSVIECSLEDVYEQENQQIVGEVDCVLEGTEEQALPHADQQPAHFGFTLTMDNIDLNVRGSFQRCKRSTQSYHFSHIFAAQNRVSDTGLQDGYISGSLSPELILPHKADWENLVSDFEAPVSRYLMITYAISVCKLVRTFL